MKTKNILLWQFINDENTCLNAIKSGFYAAIFCFLMTLAAAVIGLVINGSGSMNGPHEMVFNPFLLIDVVLIGAMAFFIYKKSRMASVIMLIYFIYGKIMMFMDGYPFNTFGIILAIALTVCFINAVRGTFYWHSKIKTIADFSAKTR